MIFERGNKREYLIDIVRLYSVRKGSIFLVMSWRSLTGLETLKPWIHRHKRDLMCTSNVYTKPHFSGERLGCWERGR